MPKPRKKRVDGKTVPEKIVPPCRDVPVTQETVRSKAVLEEIKEYAMSGCTMEQMAGRLMVNKKTLYEWSKKFPELKEVILEGKRVADDRVEQSLYDMCFPHDEREVEVEKDGDGNIIKQRIRTRHYEPNITAIQYWLQNRRTDEWKSHQSLELHSKGDTPHVTIVYDLETKEKPDLQSDDDE